uniref:N/A n=1 Tax=Ganoderma boninense TaxID=34458 RepID=A0A5K1K4G2_9APHY|nr:N/A [Ganoderma boninense]
MLQHQASQVAVEICDDFAESMHWQTYLATIRRDGSWWKGDLNVDLLTPFSSHIATGWCDLFARDFFSSLQSETLRLISAVSNEVTESVPDYLQARAKQQVEAIIHSYVEKKRHTAFQLAAKDLTEGLKEAANSIEEQLDNALSEVARTVEKNMSVLWDGPVLVGDGEDVVGPRMRMIGVLDRIISEIDARAATP